MDKFREASSVMRQLRAKVSQPSLERSTQRKVARWYSQRSFWTSLLVGSFILSWFLVSLWSDALFMNEVCAGSLIICLLMMFKGANQVASSDK